MKSIDGILGARANISYSDLKSITNGTYNKGEVVLKKGFFGGYSFGKVNNHMTSVGKNAVVTGDADNRKTNAAIFKAILTRFGKDDADAAHELLSTDLDRVGDKLLEKFGNPYIKEAFKYLLADRNDNRPVSRDEVHVLLLRLKEAERNSGYREPARVRKNMDDLAILRTFKVTGRIVDGTDTAVFNGLKGVVHADYGTKERTVLFAPTANQLGQTPCTRMEKTLDSVLTPDLRLLRVFTPSLFNGLTKRLAAVAEKYRGRELADFQTDDFALVKELVNKLTAGLSRELGDAVETLEARLAEFKRSAAYTSAEGHAPVKLPDGTTRAKQTIETWMGKLPRSLNEKFIRTSADKKQILLREIQEMLSQIVTMTCLGHDRTAEEVDRDAKDLFNLKGEISFCISRVGSGFKAEQA